jgi:hypothetical protein
MEPSQAEVARTLALGVLPAEAHVQGHQAGLRVRHATGADGAPLLLVPTAGEVATALRPVPGEVDTALVLRVDDVPPVAGAPWRGRLCSPAGPGRWTAWQRGRRPSSTSASTRPATCSTWGTATRSSGCRCASRRLRVTFPRPVDGVPDLARTLHRILCQGDRVGQGPRSHSSR